MTKQHKTSWDDIQIKITEADTRCMRPDTMGEKVDDVLGNMFCSIERNLYAESGGSTLGGLDAWLP